ncbi:GIY-YIG nuclease family protein [Halarsenatibacter silvermanii]|uniref:Uri superfamily endonuclease n=1 Tax=Halarsenatibacter silvermanii TaxID=321763 RepID=A0A1G9NGH5_9FIRM|nr:GIY-YIG nuclease family protein [Halarsenatibacter silvermanii]SDL85589.1 Uri superfamily endonuclease [Halarsenatibacter silvermanii]
MQLFSFDSGVYLLEIFVFKPLKIEVGARGKEVFRSGYYYYSGTAQKNLNARLERHKQKFVNKHWHIDYLLEKTVLYDIYAWQGSAALECKLAEELLAIENVEIYNSGFGASDCSCEAHLLHSKEKLSEDTIEELVVDEE